MIQLRSFSDSDFSRLMNWIDSRESLIQWAGPTEFAYPLTETQLRKYLAGSEGERCIRRIYTATGDDDRPCGHIELGAINYENETASLCRVLIAPDCRGKGLCVPLVQSVLEVAFERLLLRRLELRVYGFNVAGIRCYEKAGFVWEGCLRRSQKVGEQYWDTVLMGILREEWLEAQKKEMK
jgi:RimJ/RimL family protein N-acetyltransferase